MTFQDPFQFLSKEYKSQIFCCFLHLVTENFKMYIYHESENVEKSDKGSWRFKVTWISGKNFDRELRKDCSPDLTINISL